MIMDTEYIKDKYTKDDIFADIEECLKNKYNLSYCEAKDVLYYSNNDKYI